MFIFSPSFEGPKSYAAVLALLSGLALSGCAGLVGAGAAIGTIGGGLAVANEAVSLTGNSLSLAAKLACALQAEATARGDSALAKTAGQYCIWGN